MQPSRKVQWPDDARDDHSDLETDLPTATTSDNAPPPSLPVYLERSTNALRTAREESDPITYGSFHGLSIKFNYLRATPLEIDILSIKNISKMHSFDIQFSSNIKMFFFKFQFLKPTTFCPLNKLFSIKKYT